MEEKMTEEQLRHKVRREFSFSETKDKERIEKAVQLHKDRYSAIQGKKKLRDDLQKISSDDPNRVKDDPNKGNQVEEPKGTKSFTVEDSARLQEAKIPVDDWGEVKNWVEYKKMSNPEYTIKDALGDNILLNTIKERQEERTSAATIQTGKKRGGTPKISGQALLDKAKKTGVMPESDEEMDAMLEARYSKGKN